LQFEAVPREDSLLPFHGFIFGNTATRIVREAESAAQGR